jgi:hypothetical protein
MALLTGKARPTVRPRTKTEYPDGADGSDKGPCIGSLAREGERWPESTRALAVDAQIARYYAGAYTRPKRMPRLACSSRAIFFRRCTRGRYGRNGSAREHI